MGMCLPADIDISERSLKFYDGTYRLKDNGFVDEFGVFRVFDWYDPAARAPTPLPPLFLGDFAEGDHDAPVPLSIITPTDKSTVSIPRSSSALPTSSIEYPPVKALEIDSLLNGPAEYSFPSDSTNGTSVAMLQQDLFPTHLCQERLFDKVESIEIAKLKAGTKISLAECYELRGTPYPGGFQSTELVEHTKPKITPPKSRYTERPTPASPPLAEAPNSPSKSETLRKTKQEPGDSPLSDYPSDLSDWEVSKTMTGTAKKIEHVREDSSAKSSPTPKRTTRGVAQKVRKTPKRASAARALTSLHQSEGGSRRRSARQATYSDT